MPRSFLKNFVLMCLLFLGFCGFLAVILSISALIYWLVNPVISAVATVVLLLAALAVWKTYEDKERGNEDGVLKGEKE